jgi:serine/threonine protein kinase
MKEFDDQYEICPYCGYDVTEEPNVLNHLYPGTMLQDRYMIGVVIGSGGFGVTYKAWDCQLDTVICIKEYYPLGIVTRVAGTKEIVVYSAQKKEEYQAGLERFLDEARNMAKFSQHENVVNAYSYFEENNTAYIVMEFLDGISFKDFLQVNDDKVNLKFVNEVILSVANALTALHGEHIIHRDISPDNIFLLSDGKIKLIDFGAARLSVRTEQSHFITLKPGYAPPEQYWKNGKQGPWTDVYALGATMYRAVTGIVPEEASDREIEDTLKPPKEMVPDLPEHVNVAIMRALSLNKEYRFQTVQEFVDVLTNKKQVLELENEIFKRKKRRRNSLVASIMILLVVAVVVGVQLISAVGGNSLNTDLDVWVCAEEDEQQDVIEDYYRNVVSQVFCADYTKVNLNITAIPRESYEETLINAFESNEGPDIYESTGLSDNLSGYAKSLESMVEDIQREDEGSCYFLAQYTSNFPEGKELPIGFAVPVAFSIQRDYISEIDMENIQDKVETLEGNEDEQIQKLVDGDCVYLIGSTADYDKVQKQIYGTYDNQKENIAGKINISTIKDAVPQYTTTFSINKDCSRKASQAADLFLQYIVSYQEQYLLHATGEKEGVEESTAFSVNIKADQEYRDKLKSVFSVLDETMDELKK